MASPNKDSDIPCDLKETVCSQRPRSRQHGLLCPLTCVCAHCCISSSEQMQTILKPSFCISLFASPSVFSPKTKVTDRLHSQDMSRIENWTIVFFSGRCPSHDRRNGHMRRGRGHSSSITEKQGWRLFQN